MKKYLFILLITSLLSSCISRLKVEVQVADRDKIIEFDNKYPKDYDLSFSISYINRFLNSWNTKVTSNQIISFIETKYNAEASPTVKQNTLNYFNQKIDEIKRLRDEATALYENKKIEDAKIKINTANLKLQELNNELGKFKLQFSDGTGVAEIQSEIQTTTVAVQQGTSRMRFSILGDELSSDIAKKENEYIWKSVFNKTIASSFLGNTDIAMILRSNPPEREIRSGDYNNNFTIKGVRMDASDVSNAIINGLTQTVNLIANTQGIPTNIGSTPASTTHPLPNQNPLVLELQSEKTKLEIKEKKLIEFKKLLLRKIELENIADAVDDADANARAKRILDYWNGLKTELIKP